MGCFKEQMETGHSMALALGQFFLLGTGTDWALDLGNCFLLQEIKKIIRLDWSRKTKSGQFHGGRGSHAGKYYLLLYPWDTLCMRLLIVLL